MNRSLLLAFALVLCVTSGALHAAPFRQVSVQVVMVPDLDDMQVQNAVITCNEVPLVLTVAGLRPPANDTRIICGQSPAAGTYVPSGSFVNVMVNCPGTENLVMLVVVAALAGALVGALVGAYLGARVARR